MIKIKNKKRMVMCIVVIILFNTLIGCVSQVHANTANSLGAKMISFFQGQQEDIDITTITEEELRVYGVFLSNFFIQGQTQLEELSLNNTTNDVSSRVSQIFFGHTENKNKINELNNIVYKAIIQDLHDNILTNGEGVVLTGKDLLKAMVDKNTVYRKNGDTVIDFNKTAFRGAFKILASSSPEFLVDKEIGIPAMTELYIDPFGNIWGAYDIERQVGDAVDIIKTSKSKVHLVLPAALNPLSFYNSNNRENRGLQNIKLPLHNSFSLGSIIVDKTINEELTNEINSYYNIPYYFNQIDKGNALSIYAINTPFTYVGETNRIANEPITEEDIKCDIEEFFKDKKMEYSDNLKIVMGNRLDVMSKTLKQNSNNMLLDKDENYMTNEELYILYEYLFGTLTTSVDKTLSDIFYFGESGNQSWADNTFDKIGMIGSNMFAKEEIDEDTQTGTGRWRIHSSNSQVLSKVAKMYIMEDISVETINYQDINKVAETDIELVETAVKSTIKQRLDAYKNFPFSGRYYVQGLSEEKDELLHALVTIANLDEDMRGKSLWERLEAKFGLITTEEEAEVVRRMIFKSFGDKDEELVKRILYQVLNTYSVVGAKVSIQKERAEDIVISKTENKKHKLKVVNDKAYAANWPGVFWGYMVEMLDMKNLVEKDEEGEVVRYDTGIFISDYLPDLPSGLVTGGTGINLNPLEGESGVQKSEDRTEEDMKSDILKRLYSLTDSRDNDYRNSWLESTINGFILNTHRSITGSKLAGISTLGGDSYQGTVGYIHIPSLKDLPFTAWIMSNYMQIYVLVLLFILIVVVFMVIMNIRTWKEGLIILLVMSLVLLIPNILVENTINIGNKVTDKIYSEKFDFWALIQHQQSLNRLKGAETGSSQDRIIGGTEERVRNMYSQESGVRLKWMAPKKDGTFSQLFNSNYLGDGLATNLTIFKWISSSLIYEQEYVKDDPLATYVYKPYNAISKDAKDYYSYAKYTVGESSSEIVEQMDGTEIPKVIDNILENIENIPEGEKYKDLFIGSKHWYDKGIYTRENEYNIFLGEDKRRDIVEKGVYPNYKDNPEKRTVSLWGLGSEKITQTILEGGSFHSTEASAGIPINLSATMENNVDPHLVAFYKNTESPYYYFYNTLKARYGDEISFKTALLEQDIYEAMDIGATTNIKNTNRTIRDYLDMEGLFTNLIPYMTISNDYVKDWIKINGTDVAEFDFESQAIQETGNRESVPEGVAQQYALKRKHKEDMEKVWMMYTPWVDQLNSLNFKIQTIKVGSSKENIVNTLNPSEYMRAGRPMVFSELDMVLKGITEKDLTAVEIRIQNVLRETQKDLMYLVNYYDLDDEVLLNAAAMAATFNFNREFSDTTFVGESVMLYPQNYEMKNFNYDAFMRMIMLNATGESVFGEQDLYKTILSKTSFFTGVMLLIVDVLAVIVIPTMKIIIILMLLFLSILLCITSVISPPEKLIQVIMKSLIVPTLVFLGTNIVFAWLVSLLVGEGLTSYVGSKGVSITTNDPTITIGILIIMSVCYVIVMWKTLTLLFKSLKSYGLAGVMAGVGIVVSSVTAAAKTATNNGLQVLETTGGVITGGITKVAKRGSSKGRETEGVTKIRTGSKASTRINYSINRSRKDKQESRTMKKDNKHITEKINTKANKRIDKAKQVKKDINKKSKKRI